MSLASELHLPSIAFAELCDRGLIRAENQDAVLRIRVAVGDLAVVADGIGGYAGGAQASQFVVEAFRSHLSSLPPDYPPDYALREAAQKANLAIQKEASRPGSTHRRMGSTVVAALIRRNGAGAQAWVAHVGDSRAYLFRSGRLTPLTRDHSAVQELLDQNLITPNQARRHPDANVLTRSLGQTAEVEIDLDCHDLEPTDSLLLCSDGLWGLVPTEQIEAVLSNPALSADAAAQTLLALALQAGGRDNVGLVLARLGQAPRPPQPETAPQPQPRRRRGRGMLALGLLIAVVLLAALWTGFSLHWFHAILPGIKPPTPAVSVPSAESEADRHAPVTHTFALVFAEDADPREIPRIPGWSRAQVTPDHFESCHLADRAFRRITVFYDGSDPSLVDRFVRRNPTVFGDSADLDIHPSTDELRAACGRFELIAFIPARGAAAHPRE
jgi:protein phosphatase